MPRGTGQRLSVADLTLLHAAHRREDIARPEGKLPPFGRPNRRSPVSTNRLALLGICNLFQTFALAILFSWLWSVGPAQILTSIHREAWKVAQILFDHADASGTVLAWELTNEAKRG